MPAKVLPVRSPAGQYGLARRAAVEAIGRGSYDSLVAGADCGELNALLGGGRPTPSGCRG